MTSGGWMERGALLERLDAWRVEDEAAPALFRQAWDRAIDLVTPHWHRRGLNIDGPVLADGGAALALALYIVAGEQHVAPSQVTRQQVEALLERPQGSWLWEAWEGRLRSLGHDLGNVRPGRRAVAHAADRPLRQAGRPGAVGRP